MKKVNIKEGTTAERVKVDFRGTASITELADTTRNLKDKEFKSFVRLANEFRRADKHAERYIELLDELLVSARTLSNKEWRQTVKFAKTLRKADRELTKSELVEKRAKQARLDQLRRSA